MICCLASVHLFVNFGCTNLGATGKMVRVHMFPLSVETLGDMLLAILEIGHSDLHCGFYRAKFVWC